MPEHRHCRLVIIGAGPHGLTTALRAVESGLRPGTDIEILDPSGAWLTEWKCRFAAHRITSLRSPGVHHPGSDPGALHAFADGCDRRSTAAYGQPHTDAFNAFCDHLVDQSGLTDAVTPARAQLLAADDGEVTILCSGHDVITADRAVLATNPGRRRIPPWVHDLLPMGPEQLAHAADVDLNGLDLAGETVTIVGGGLTAAQLALGAVDCGADHVQLVIRRRVRSSTFDVDPGWLGPRHLTGFADLDPAVRADAILNARNGGSLPQSVASALRRTRDRGRLALFEDARVVAGADSGGLPLIVLGDETHLRADRLWLATGTDCTVDACRLLDDVMVSHRCDVHGGLPDLDDDLSWPGTALHITGRLAALQLGPASGNLWGARRAAERIIPLGVVSHPSNAAEH